MSEGHDIAVWFRENHALTYQHGQTAEGFDFTDETYVWVAAFVDLDQDAFFLLDVRTSLAGAPETRDFLFLGTGVTFGKQTPFEWWSSNLFRFDAPADEHLRRLHDGLVWFAGRIEFWLEDHAFGDRRVAPVVQGVEADD